MTKLTLEEGLEIQRKDLAIWKPKLNPEVYKDLVVFANTDTENWSDGFDVKRGDTLKHFIVCWKPFDFKKTLHDFHMEIRGELFAGLSSDYGVGYNFELLYEQEDITIEVIPFEVKDGITIKVDVRGNYVSTIEVKFREPTTHDEFEDFKKRYIKFLHEVPSKMASVDEITLDTHKNTYTVVGLLIPNQTITFTSYGDWDCIQDVDGNPILDCQLGYDEGYNFQYSDLNWIGDNDDCEADYNMDGDRSYGSVTVDLLKDHGYDVAVNFGIAIGSQTVGWFSTINEANAYIKRVKAKDCGLVEDEWQGDVDDITHVWVEPCKGPDEDPLHNLTTRLIDQFYIKYDSMSEYGDEETKRELDRIVRNYVK